MPGPEPGRTPQGGYELTDEEAKAVWDSYNREERRKEQERTLREAVEELREKAEQAARAPAAHVTENREEYWCPADEPAKAEQVRPVKFPHPELGTEWATVAVFRTGKVTADRYQHAYVTRDSGWLIVTGDWGQVLFAPGTVSQVNCGGNT